MTRILEGKNRATPSEAASFVDQFEELEAEIASERGTFMAKCKAIRERQKDLLEDAKSQGVGKGLVKSIAKARELEAKAKAIRDEMEDDDRAFFIDIRKALGDDYSALPLGAAAVAREDGNGVDPIAAAADKAWNDGSPATH
jgi:hypothetical protein